MSTLLNKFEFKFVNFAKITLSQKLKAMKCKFVNFHTNRNFDTIEQRRESFLYTYTVSMYFV